MTNSVIPGPKPPYHYSRDGGRFNDKPYTPPSGMELVHVGQEPGGLPYIVYRFHSGAVR